MHKELPRTQILPGMAHHGALVHHGKHRHLPLSKNERRTAVDCASADTSRDIATNGPRPIIRPSTKRRPGIAVQMHPTGAHAQATATATATATASISVFRGYQAVLRIYAHTAGRDAAARLKVFFSSRRSCSRRPRAPALGEATGDGEGRGYG